MRVGPVIIFGAESDPHVQFLRSSIECSTPFVFDYNSLPKLKISTDHLYISGRSFNWSDIILLWRLNTIDILPPPIEFATDKELRYWRDQWNSVLNYVSAKVAVCRQINHRGLAARAASKLALPDLCALSGANCPDQCVSNDVTTLSKFQSGRAVVYKRLGSALASDQVMQYTIEAKQDIRDFADQVAIAPNLI